MGYWLIDSKFVTSAVFSKRQLALPYLKNSYHRYAGCFIGAQQLKFEICSCFFLDFGCDEGISYLGRLGKWHCLTSLKSLA